MMQAHRGLCLRAFVIGIVAYGLTSLVYGILLIVGTVISEDDFLKLTLIQALWVPFVFGLKAPAAVLPLPHVAYSVAEYRIQQVVEWACALGIWLLYFGAIYAGLYLAARRGWGLKKAAFVIAIIAAGAYAICWQIAWNAYWERILWLMQYGKGR